jgi:hypothetical protein
MATIAMARSVLFAALCLVAATSVAGGCTEALLFLDSWCSESELILCLCFSPAAAIPSGTYTLTSEIRAKNECNCE